MGIIPAPSQQDKFQGQFILPPQPVITYDSSAAASVVKLTAEALRARFGVSSYTELIDTPGTRDPGTIHLSLQEDVECLAGFVQWHEAYELQVSERQVLVRAMAINGIFYGVQSLLQLLPASLPPDGQDITSEATRIVDAPRFRWRGALLDVGRHFFSVEFVKRFIDVLAMHKMNVFHWHLTEDQGWRPEVKQLQRLTEVAAWRSSDGGTSWYGGYYTQEEMRDVVEYARERCIDVMPEIELPGHCCASLAAYPELSCSRQVAEVPHQWGIHEHIYCAGNDDVFRFLETVLEEITDIFPFEYLHIGGDEVPKVQWKHCPKCQERMREEGLEHEGKLQSWFIQRISDFLASKGKKIVGWDEILEGGLVQGSTVMSWRGTRGGVIAAKMGHDVIMTPTSHCYFDYRQSKRPGEPGAWYALLPIETVYEFDPMLEPLPPPPDVVNGQPSSVCVAADEALTDKEKSHILGGQANVWTEYIGDEETVEYMLLLRLCALAEALWTPRESRSWDCFRLRLDQHVKHLDFMGLRYRGLDQEGEGEGTDGDSEAAEEHPPMEE